MRILYVGTLDPDGTCYSRWCALRELEPEVHGFDSRQHLLYSTLGSVRRRLATHAHVGPVLRRGNEALKSACLALKPDLVWIEKGEWIWSSTLRFLREQGCFLVHYVTDALNHGHWKARLQCRLLRTTIPDYDVFITTNDRDYAQLAAMDHPTAIFTDLGYDHRRFEPTPLPAELVGKWNNPVVFVGHYEPHTEAGLLALIDSGLPLKVFGPPPWGTSKIQARLRDHVFPRLSSEDYVHALKGAKIGLCFVSALNYNQTAARSFEIPGCGTFLLAVRTPQHLTYFKEGVEAGFFGDHRELVDKTRYYLKHEAEREAIARRGHERCISSGYSWDGLMKRDWPKVKQLYSERRRS